MRIGYLTSVYPRATDTFIRTEVEQLREIGFDVRTFSIREAPDDQFLDGDIRAERTRTTFFVGRGRYTSTLWLAFRGILAYPGGSARAAWLCWIAGAKGVRARLKQVAYLCEALALAFELQRQEIGHLHNHIGENSAFVAMLASEISDVPFSCTFHGPEFVLGGEISLRWKVTKAAFTVCISEFCRSQCMIFADIEDWPKIKCIRCSPHPSFLEREVAPIPEGNRFVYVSRLTAAKGAIALVEAASELRTRGYDFRIHVVGNGDVRHRMEAMVAGRELSDSFRFEGWLDSGAVLEQVRAAKALVVPSFVEGIPVAIMEAFSLGRPVVTTRVGGIAELVVSGRSGWVIAPGSIAELVAAMEGVMAAPPEQLSDMGKRGREDVRVLHDVEIEVGKLSKLFGASVRGELIGG